MKKILFKTLENGKGLYKLQKATLGSAGFDLVAAILDKKSLKPNETDLIPCGFSLELPKSYEAQVRPRSGIALKNQVTVLNTPGTIDSDYRGEIGVILINHGKNNFDIERGMRIAQIIFQKLPDIIEGLSSVLSFLAPIIRTLVNAVMTLYDGIRNIGGKLAGGTGMGLVDAGALALLFGGKFGKGGRLLKGAAAGGRGMSPLALAALTVGGGAVAGTADNGSLMQILGLTAAGYGLMQGAGAVKAAGGISGAIAKGAGVLKNFKAGPMAYITAAFLGYQGGKKFANAHLGGLRDFFHGPSTSAADTFPETFNEYFMPQMFPRGVLTGIEAASQFTGGRDRFNAASGALEIISEIHLAKARGTSFVPLLHELDALMGGSGIGGLTDDNAEEVFNNILNTLGFAGPDQHINVNSGTAFLQDVVDSQLLREKTNLIDTQKVAVRSLGEFADELDVSTTTINEFITAFGYDPMNLLPQHTTSLGLMYAASMTLFDRNRAIMPSFDTSRTVQMERQASASAALNALMMNPNFTSADVTDFFSKQAAYEVSLGNPVDLATLSGVQELKFHMGQGRFGPVGSDSYNRMKDLTETAERTIFEEMSGRYFLGMDTLTAFGSGANGGQIQLGALDKYLTAIQLQRQAVSGTAGMGFSKRLGILGGMGFGMDSQVFKQFMSNVGLKEGDIQFNEDGSILNQSLMDFAANDERFDEEEFTRALSIAFIESDMGSATEAQTLTLEKAIRDIPNSMTNWSIYLNDGSDGGGSYITLSGPDGYLKVPVGDQPVSIDGHLRGLME